MRGLAYRRQQKRVKYSKRATQIYKTYGGYIVKDNKVVKCSTVKEYINYGNPYLLKTQGNFEHHCFFADKWDKKIQKVKDKEKVKKMLRYSVDENDLSGDKQGD